MRTFLSILLLALVTAGCGDDFTLLAPESQRNVDNFFDKPGDFEVAINGVYDALQLPGTYGGNYWMAMEMRSDNTDQGPDVTGLSATIAAINDFKESTISEEVLSMWRDSYVGIARANLLLDRLAGFSMEQDLKDRIRGEALFIRSLLYYNLAMIYGRVPLILDPTTSPNQEINQTEQADVLQQAATDLEEAAALLPASYTGANVGRATSGAANALLGKVYLTLGQDAAAVDALREVVNSGVYSLVDDYADLWGPENENNSEVVFAVQFKAGGTGEGSPFTNLFSPSSFLQNGEGAYRNRPTQDLIDAFSEDDERFGASLAVTYVNADGETVDAPHVIKYRSEPFANFDADNNWIVMRYAEVLLLLAEALGESDEAYSLINDVRARAGLDPIGAGDPGSFDDKLLRERRLELAFENHRWFDLMRFGRTDMVAAAEASVEVVNPLFPIPQREIDTSPDVLSQNDPY